MANDNQGSRTFLAIVLGGIVLALVIAAYFSVLLAVAWWVVRSGRDTAADYPAR